MGRKSHHTFSKRQRDLKKAEKAAEKQARRAERKSDIDDPASQAGESSTDEDGHEPVDADGSDRAGGEQPTDEGDAPTRSEGET